MEISSKRQVLIVDDAVEITRRLRALLEEIEWINTAEPACTGAAAVLALRARHPDVMILDLGLPDMNGMDLIKIAKEENPSCRVVVLTVHDEEEFRTRCRDAGADAFLSKAHEFDRVVDVVKELTMGAAPGDAAAN